MKNGALQIRDRLLEHDFVKIVTHIDADGITAGAIASKVLERANIDYDIVFLKQLNVESIEKLKEENNSLVWFTDMGSGMLEHLTGLNYVICDHHELSTKKMSPLSDLSIKQRTDLMEFSRAYSARKVEAPLSTGCHFNPHLFGRDGAIDVSGAGMAYLVGRAFSRENRDLAALAVVGAVGDIQCGQLQRLSGTNQGILGDGIDVGVIESITDLYLFGRETRPIYKMLQYSSDPILPGLSGHGQNCMNFLETLNIPQKDGVRWLSWSELQYDHKQRIVSSLSILLVEKGFGGQQARRLLGEVYLFPEEEKGTVLHEAKEFSTLLNSCGRYNQARLGWEVCMGDRDSSYRKALLMLKGHRKKLVDSLKVVKEIGLTVMENLQFFDAGERIPDGIVGVVANMVMGQKDVDAGIPIFGFADSQDEVGKVKVSGRGTALLVREGLELNEAMNLVASRFGGIGGGHKVAAGATIPASKKMEFIDQIQKVIGKQLSR